jgi:S1-C subfamily serine protease
MWSPGWSAGADPDAGIAPPPLYDPREFATGFGAAGGTPPGFVADPIGAGPAGDARPNGSPGSGGPNRSRRSPSVPVAVLIGVVSAVIAALVTGGLFIAFDRNGRNGAGNGSPPPTYLTTSLDIHGLLDHVQPSVVLIRADVPAPTAPGSAPMFAGSGVIISDDGLVLTNSHLVATSSSIRVTLFDGAVKPATLVGSFPDGDVALVRIEDPGRITPAELGSSADLRVGDPVVAIGNALNLGGSASVTEGIVSAKDRNIQTPEGTLTDLIQTDAAINPGNSGGPLINASGQVVGINTAIINDAQNIGFAISIDVVKPRIEDLKRGKGTITPDTAFLGVQTQSLADVTQAVLDRYGVSSTAGAFVSDVVPGSSAADSGLKPGDVITSIDGHAITSAADIGASLRDKKAGDHISIEFEREGAEQTAAASLKSRSQTGR